MKKRIKNAPGYYLSFIFGYIFAVISIYFLLVITGVEAISKTSPIENVRPIIFWLPGLISGWCFKNCNDLKKE
jgi:hypothetical protein